MRAQGHLHYSAYSTLVGIPVSVAAATCADANMASTASIIRGEAALAWLAGLGVPARLVAESGAVVTLGGWPPDQPSAR